MLLFVALVVAFALYWPVLHGEFVFDDYPSVATHERVWRGEWRKIPWKQERSIPYFSLALQVFLHGPVPQGQGTPPTLFFALHSFNVILHALTAFVAGAIVGLAHPELRLISSLLWVAMPVAVASAAYISSRATLFAGLFSLSALWCVLAGYPVLALPLIVLTVMSKEDHAALPLGLAFAADGAWSVVFAAIPLVFAAVFHRRIRAIIGTSHSPGVVDAGVPEPFPSEWRRLTVVTELALRFPQWVCGFALCAAPSIKKPHWNRVLLAFGVLELWYLAFALAPSTRLPLALVLASPLTLYAVFPRVRDPLMDYRAYVAMIGPFLLLLPLLSIVEPSLIFVVWCVVSRVRIIGWRSPMDLWRMTVDDGGGPVAWINLGAAYQMRKEFGKARECFNECLKLHPETGVALLNLGLIEGMEGRPEGARDKIEECVRLNPRYIAAWDFLRQVYEFLKDQPNAERCRVQVESLKC